MKTLHGILNQRLEKYRNRLLFTAKRGLRRKHWTGADIIEGRTRVAALFRNRGFTPGDTYMIWGQNSPEWVLTLLAGLENGYVAVPADARSQWSTVEGYVRKTKPKFAVVSVLLKPFFKADIPVFTLEDIVGVARAESVGKTKAPKTLPENIEIVFTSGSSGTPKGVVLTQKNLIAQLDQVQEMLPPLNRFETVSILPLSHAYEQIYGLFLPILAGGTVHYLERFNPLTLRRELKRSHATYLLSVPQMLRLMYDGILRNVEAKGSLRAFTTLLKIARHLPMPMRRVLFNEVHAQFGGNIRFMASGSAPLEPKLANVWEAMGFEIIEGYGATETTGMVTAMSWKRRKFGTVGKPARFAEVKLGKDNEILVKGPIVSPGYFEDEKKTKEAFDGAWYKTEDIGSYDEEGLLKITGRISTRIILSDGTKVYPEDIERLLNDQPEVKDSCITESGTRGEAVVHAWIVPQNANVKDVGNIIRRVNELLESKQQILSFDVWPNPDFPRLRSRKVDRNAVKSYTNMVRKDSGKLGTTHEVMADLDTILISLSGKKTVAGKERLGDDLRLDSLRRIQLAAMVEQYLGVQINEFNLSAQTTVDELRDSIRNGGSAGGEGHSWDEIVNHWRFNPAISVLRTAVLKGIIFPLHARVVKVSVDDKENILKSLKGPALLVFNHPGLFDLFCTMRIIPGNVLKKSAVAATEDRWEDGNTAIRTLIDFTICGYPIGRKGPWMVAGLEATGELVDRGYSILFAPEGEMQREGKLQPFLPGLGYLAKELDIPAYMFKLDTKEWQEIWPPPAPGEAATDSRYYFPRKRGCVTLKVSRAEVDASLSSDNLTRSLERQFEDL